MIDDISRNKSAIIQRCLIRISEEYQGHPARLDEFTVQDSVVLNLLRACEAAIDLAMHYVADGRLGVPQSSRDAFSLLERAGKISSEVSASMKNMVGFRNIAVHSYQDLQRPILEALLERHLGDFESFVHELSR